MTDAFSSLADNVSAPSTHATTVTPSDTVDLTNIPKAIYIGGAGDVVVIGVNAPTGATGVTFKAVAAGTILPVRARRLLATGTTATNIVALY